MAYRALAALVVLGAVGCSAGSDPGESGPCAERSGAYVVTWRERAGGTCGSIPDQVIIADPDAGPGSGSSPCTGTPTESADHCKTNGTVTCSGVKQTIACTFSRDGRSGSCVATVQGDACLSTYDMTMTRQ